MDNLKGKVAFITGGARDIGAQISIKLAEKGVKVCFNYFGSKEKAEETLSKIKSGGGNAISVQGDMTKLSEVQDNINKCREAFGDKIDILVNNAGGLVARKSMAEMDEEFWDKVISLNLKSTFLVTKAAFPYLNEKGSVINLSSQAARDGGGPGAIAYSTAKGAVLTFTRGLAKELGPKNIRVNAVSPGMINTTFHDTFTKPEVREKVASGAPLRREGEASDVADLVVYLASDKAAYITGASIEINGGTYFI